MVPADADFRRRVVGRAVRLHEIDLVCLVAEREARGGERPVALLHEDDPHVAGEGQVRCVFYECPLAKGTVGCVR